MLKHILVPTDGTKLSARAVRMACSLAKTCGARITADACVLSSGPRRRGWTKKEI